MTPDQAIACGRIVSVPTPFAKVAFKTPLELPLLGPCWSVTTRAHT
jgi:hypothetical protein